ncbi:MAG: hypothetical protein JXR63_05320 [Spirochaetales bacterium]|nr:hypothetical protein [Spirochaetales bacterium]
MSKAHRGKGTSEFYNHGRGNCPVCGRTGIKAVYEIEVSEKKLTVCKQCKVGVSRGKLDKSVAAL